MDIERGGTDCDDANADAYPGAAFMDSTTECMLDADGDGWGDDSATGYTTPGSDCDDSDAAVHPGQLDWADGEDDNCDGLVDENGDLDDAAWALFYGRSGERMGKVLASVPDRDGDGLPELLIGSDEPKNSAGRFYVVEGLGAGVQALENVGLSLTGDSGSYDHMVEAVGTGDFDDDGLGDVLTGSRYWDLGSGNDNTGRAVILWGTDSGHLLAEDLSVGWVGSGNNQELGETLAGLGDWDGDGIDDFAVGEQGVGTPTAHLLLGGSLSSGTIDDAAELSVGTTGHDGWPGLELVQCQDLDGDGLSDWVISWYYDNTVWVIDSGLSGSMDLDDAAGVTWTGESGSGYFGYAVAAIGDYDGDGLSDLAISEYRKGSGYFGGFWVVPGGTTTSDKVTEVAILEVEGVEPWEFDGRSIGGGDITGDGHSEVFSGSVYMSRVSIYEGNQTGTLSTSDADVVFESGEDESDTFLGEDVVYLGDISGDGVGDLALSAWQTTYPPQSSEDEGFAPTGTVWVLLGGLR